MRLIRFSTLLFLVVGVLAGSSLAGGISLSVTPSEVSPGDALTIAVSGAPENSRVVLFASLDNTPSTLGPRETRCGMFEVNLDLTPRALFPIRTDANGEATLQLPIPPGLPGQLDGLTVYAQAAAVTFSVDPGPPPSCVIDVCVSELGSTTLVIP